MRARLLSLLAVALAAPAWALEPNIISTVEVKDAGNEVVLTVLGSRKPSFTTFSMADPPRFVIDFSESKFQGVPDEVPGAGGVVQLVKNLSYGSGSTAIARVMVAFSVEVDPPSVEDSGNGLVVRITKPGSAPAVALAPDADAKAKADADAQAKADTDAKAKADADAQAKADADAQAKADADVKAKADADAQTKAKADADSQAKADADAQAKADADAKANAVAAPASTAPSDADADQKEIAAAKNEKDAKADADAQASAAAAPVSAAPSDADADQKALEKEIAAAKNEKDAKADAKAAKEAAKEAKARELEAKKAAKLQAKEEAKERARQAQEEKARKAALAKAAKALARDEAQERAQQAKEEKARELEEKKAARARAKEEATAEKAAPAAAGGDQSDLDAEIAAAREQARKDASEVEGLSPDAPLARIREVGFKQLPGVSRVFVRTSADVQYTVQDLDDRTVRIELENTRVLRYNDLRYLDTSFFPSAVQMITPSRQGTSYVITVKLRERVPYEQKRVGDMLAVDFQRPASAAGTPAKPPPEEKGAEPGASEPSE